MKKQRTRWVFLYRAGGGTYMKIGWVYNVRTGYAGDKIRIKIRSSSPNSNVELHMTLDEALALVYGIGKVLTVETIAHNIEVKE